MGDGMGVETILPVMQQIIQTGMLMNITLKIDAVF